MTIEEIGYSLIFLLKFKVPIEKWPKQILDILDNGQK